jgi:hypothetical protein
MIIAAWATIVNAAGKGAVDAAVPKRIPRAS